MDVIIIKNFSSAKDNSKRIKRQATDQERIFAKDISGKGQNKEFLKLNNKK